MDPGSPPFFSNSASLSSLLLSLPLPHYLSALSYHCCDYGCHAVLKRSAINRPEIKPKNEFPQCRPHALLSRNYLAGEWLITPLRRQRQKHTRRDSVLTKAGSNGSKDAYSAFTPSDHRAHGMYSTLQYKTLSPQIPVFIFSKISVRY